MSRSFRIELLDEHDREQFDCGQEELNKYFKTLVSQEVRRLVTKCYVLVENETEEVAGYYTLAAASVPLRDLPEQITKRLPRYPSVPVVRLGRMAVDLRYRQRKLGDVLIADAIQRSIESDIGICAVVVDAKDDALVEFYKKRGFISLSSAGRTLFLPLTGEPLKRLARST